MIPPPRSLSAQMSRLAVPIYLSNLVEMALPILTFFRIAGGVRGGGRCGSAPVVAGWAASLGLVRRSVRGCDGPPGRERTSHGRAARLRGRRHAVDARLDQRMMHACRALAAGCSGCCFGGRGCLEGYLEGYQEPCHHDLRGSLFLSPQDCATWAT
jgi:hypothetical protein